MVNTGSFTVFLTDRRVWAGLVVLLALILGWPVAQSPVVWPDSEAYLAGSPDRLPVYSLLASLLRDSYLLICFQFVLSLAAWTALGYVVAGAAGLLVASLIALAGPVTLWNHTVLSESLSLTLFAGTLAATFLLLRQWTRKRIVLWCLLAVLFAFTRSTNVFMIPFFVVPFVLRGRRQIIVTAAVALLLLVSWSVYGNTVGKSLRETSLLNVYLNRIMHDHSRVAFFVERGMPLSNAIGSFVDRMSRQNLEEMFEAEPEFAEWFRKRGASSYQLWLLSRPLSFQQAWGVMADNVNYTYPEYDDGMKFRGSTGVATTAYNFMYLPWWLWILCATAPLLSYLVLKRLFIVSLFIPAIMAGAYVQAYVGYHGDATEMGRHCILSLIGYKTVVLLMVLFLWQMVRSGIQLRQAASASGPGRDRSRKRKSRRKKSGK